MKAERINIRKKELTERTFVPYELTISVESEDQHRRLHGELGNVELLIYKLRSPFRHDSYGVTLDLLDKIRKHDRS